MSILAGEEIVADEIPGIIAVDPDTANSGNITTVETVVHSVTAGLLSGRTYKVTLNTLLDASVNGDSAAAFIREDNLTGTQLQGVTKTMVAAAVSEDVHPIAYYTAVATGSKTFVATVIRTAGTGNIVRIASSTNPSYLDVELTRL